MTNKFIYWAIYLCLMVLFSNCGSETLELSSEGGELTEYLKEEMADQQIPALSVLAFADGDMVYEENLGQSNIAQNTALQADHLFLLASASKMITGTALLQLYENGSFGLDESINDYLSFPVRVPNMDTPITFRMLLTHTSGIADGSALDDQYYYGEDSPVELKDFLKNYLTPAGSFYNASENFHNFEPGSRYEYSNTGSALVGLLVEEIAEMDFANYCRENIFTPLSMNNTHWRLAEITETIVQPYDNVNGRNERIEHYTFTDYPNGGLRSTARDLFKFLRVLAQEGTAEGVQLLKTTTVREMLLPQIPAIDEEVGLHIFKMDARNNLWGHDGGERGVATIMAFNPTNQKGVIILSNQGEAELEELLVEVYQSLD